MHTSRSIVRVALLLLAFVLLVDLNRKTNDRAGSIAEFKFKMMEKLRTDSLDSKHKAELLLNETTKFMGDSSHVRKRVHYLTGLLGLWVIIELGFFLKGERLRRTHKNGREN